MSVKIMSVVKGSPCGKKNIGAGDELLTINGKIIDDVLDYRFFIDSEKLLLEIKKPNGKIKRIKVKKDEDEEPGLEFETYLMDSKHHCKNKCIFCFIDQLPKGLRESLYFKDDDSRLSFLFGNYITLTNLTEHEANRITELHISPVNVSVHTMNPELRVQMMNNKNAGESLKYLRQFADSGIKINTQLVLCPGINDGKELEYSLEKLGELYPAVQSIAAVPVGLSKFRDGLCSLKPYTKEKAAEVIDTIDSFNLRNDKKNVPQTAYVADELYLKAEREIPSEKYYGDFPQLENGVGLWAILKYEFMKEIGSIDEESLPRKPRRATVATGKAAYPLICELSALAENAVNNLKINVVQIENRFFGEEITVAGLITGKDFYEQLKGLELGDELIIPSVSLRNEGDMFLDSMTLDELSQKLGISIVPAENSGSGLLGAMLGSVL